MTKFVPVSNEFDSSKKKSFFLSFLFSYLWSKNPYSLKLRVIVSVLCLSCGKFLGAGIPISYKYLVDELSNSSIHYASAGLIAGGLIAYGLTRIFTQVFNELRDMIFAKVGQRAIRQIALTVFQHLFNLSLSFHITRRTGGVIRAIERGTKGIETFLRFCLFNIVPTILEISLICGILWYLYEFLFALISFCTILIYIIYTLSIAQWRVNFVRIANKVDAQSHHTAAESLLNFETVKYFGNEEHEREKFDSSLQQYEKAMINSSRGLSILNIGQNIIISTGLMCSMWLAAIKIEEGTMSLGDFILINTYLIQVSMPLFMLGFAYLEIKNSIVSMEDMFALLNIPPEIIDNVSTKELEEPVGTVSFDRVSFSYNANRQILHDISFKVESGKMIAIIGASGSGKSTIARLLFRFFDVNSGSITIDDIDIRELKQSSLRSLIGVVPQDTVLFNDTIYYNILYGRLSATHEEIIEAAKLANIHEQIISLPEQYNTIVGERGLKMSGGEKQRIAIARTILKNPLIYIFDEATSALDTNNEKQIQESLRAASSHKTKIVIAHRLSTITDADEIICIDNGAVVERGTHAQLLQLKMRYFEMWNVQQSESSS